MTYGSVASQQNTWAGDVFLTAVSLDAVLTAGFSKPVPGAVTPPVGTPPPINMALIVGALAITGIDTARWEALSAILLLVGAVMRRIRLSRTRFAS